MWHLTTASKDGYGLLIDTGARGSLCGRQWIKLYNSKILIPNKVRLRLRRNRMAFHGVGKGSMQSKYQFEIPIQVHGLRGTYTGQLMDKEGSHLRPRLSLPGM